MSNGFGFEDSGTWGGAGVALGVGFLEGRIEAQRHRELVAAMQNGANTNTYVEYLEEAHKTAEILLLKEQSRSKNKDAQIGQLEGLIAQYKILDADRIKTINRLRDTLVSYDASTQHLIASKNKIIASQEALLLKKDALTKLMEAHITKRDSAIASSERIITLRKKELGIYEVQVGTLTRRGDRLQKMFGNAECKIERLKDACSTARAERDEYLDRLVRIARGEVVADPAAPAAVAQATTEGFSP